MSATKPVTPDELAPPSLSTISPPDPVQRPHRRLVAALAHQHIRGRDRHRGQQGQDRQHDQQFDQRQAARASRTRPAAATPRVTPPISTPPCPVPAGRTTKWFHTIAQGQRSGAAAKRQPWVSPQRIPINPERVAHRAPCGTPSGCGDRGGTSNLGCSRLRRDPGLRCLTASRCKADRRLRNSPTKERGPPASFDRDWGCRPPSRQDHRTVNATYRSSPSLRIQSSPRDVHALDRCQSGRPARQKPAARPGQVRPTRILDHDRVAPAVDHCRVTFLTIVIREVRVGQRKSEARDSSSTARASRGGTPGRSREPCSPVFGLMNR